MKKIVLITILLSFILTSCGTSSGKYDEDFDNAMASIEEMRTNADYVMNVNIALWDAAGPDNVARCINGMLTAIEDENSSIDGGTYIFKAVTGKDIYGKVSSWDQTIHQKCWPVIEQYQNSYNSLLEQNEVVKNDVKLIKDNYGKKHPDAAQALQDYFVKAAAYAEAATNPTGNLISYSSSHVDFEKEMEELKANADFNK